MNPKADSFIGNTKDNDKDYVEPRLFCQMPLQWFTWSKVSPHLYLQMPHSGYYDMEPVLHVFILLVPVLYRDEDSFIYSLKKRLTSTTYYSIYGRHLSALENVLTWSFLHHILKYWSQLFKLLLKLACFSIYIYFPITVYSGMVIHIL